MTYALLYGMMKTKPVKFLSQFGGYFKSSSHCQMFKTDWLIFFSVFKEINDALLLCAKVELQVRVFDNMIVPYQDAFIGVARIEKKSPFHGTLLTLALCFIATISPNTCSVQKSDRSESNLLNQICTTPRWRRECGTILFCLAG